MSVFDPRFALGPHRRCDGFSRIVNFYVAAVVKFYADAEAILSHLSRRGLPMILREVEDGKAKPYSFSANAPCKCGGLLVICAYRPSES